MYWRMRCCQLRGERFPALLGGLLLGVCSVFLGGTFGLLGVGNEGRVDLGAGGRSRSFGGPLELPSRPTLGLL